MGNVGSIEQESHMQGEYGEVRFDGANLRSTSKPAIRYKSFQGGKASNPTMRQLLMGACCTKGGEHIYPPKNDRDINNRNLLPE